MQHSTNVFLTQLSIVLKNWHEALWKFIDDITSDIVI